MRVNEVLEKCRQGAFDEKLLYLCVDESVKEAEKKRIIKNAERYKELFGDQELSCFSAPGRSEILGNHTDHQLGKVIAAGINRDAVALAGKNGEDKIRICSEGFDPFEVDLKACALFEKGTSESLVKGIAAEMMKRGYLVQGFNAVLDSEVKVGSGCSSSACFEVLIASIISGLFNENRVDPVEIAVIAQIAENEYFGKPSGLMDQMACSLGGLTAIDFKQKDRPVVRQLPSAFLSEAFSLVLIDTGASHQDLTDDYAAIVGEISEVCRFFNKEVLREVDQADFVGSLARLRELCSDRAILRAMHVFDENSRVEECVEAVEKEDLNGFIDVLCRSGQSSFEYLQNVYSPSHPDEQSCALALALAASLLKGKGAYRIHGGGFAGTILTLVPEELMETFVERMESVFGKGAAMICKIRPIGACKIF